MNILAGIANPAMASPAEAFQIGRDRKKERETNELANSILSETIGGKIGELALLDGEKAAQVAESLGIPMNAQGRLNSFVGDVVNSAALIRAGQGQQAANYLSEKVDMLSGLGLDPSNYLEIVEGINNPETQGQAFETVLALHDSMVNSGMIKGADQPDSFRALDLRAQAAGYKPGTKPYKEFMRNNGQVSKPKLDIVQVFRPDGSAISAFDDGQGTFTDLRGQPLQLSEQDRVIKGSTLTGGANDLGISNKEQIMLRDLEVNTTNLVDDIEQAQQLLSESPDINTFVARGAALVNGLQQEAKAIARATGVEFDESLLDPNTYGEDFDELGIKNEQMKALFTNLAFSAAAANGQTGRSVSDKDVSRFLQMVGAGSSNPQSINTILEDLKKRSVGRLGNQYQVRANEVYEGPLLERIATSSASSSGPVTITTKEEFDALPSGTVYTQADGQRYRKP